MRCGKQGEPNGEPGWWEGGATLATPIAPHSIKKKKGPKRSFCRRGMQKSLGLAVLLRLRCSGYSQALSHY